MPQGSVLATRCRLVCVACGAPDAGAAKTKVKFQLQRKCMFGEHFKVVGAHSALGEWNPEAGVPLEWSDGHDWTAEVDVPQGEEYEFKFVLQCGHGGVDWQPGPNRVFSTLEGPAELVVTQTWELGVDSDAGPVAEERETVSSEGEEEEQENVPSVAEVGHWSLDSEEPVTEQAETRMDFEEPVTENEQAETRMDSEEPGTVKEQETVEAEAGRSSSDSEELAAGKEQESAETSDSNLDFEEPVDVDIETKYETQGNEVQQVEAEIVVDLEVKPALTLWQKDRSWFQSTLSKLVSIFIRS